MRWVAFVGVVVLAQFVLKLASPEATTQATQTTENTQHTQPDTLGEQEWQQEKQVVNPEPTQPKETLYSVVKVTDGDTLKVNIGGITETIRLVGMDTPETVHPTKPVECFGIEASNKAKELLSGKQVSLEADSTQGDRDKCGRLLRYVFLSNGTHFNRLMISEGYAHEYTYNTPYKYQAEFKQAEKEARENSRGLWGEVCNSYQEPTPTQTNCDCGGNIYNCSDFSTHAEAQSCYESCGGVGNDIHRLDRDKDGLACEALP